MKKLKRKSARPTPLRRPAPIPYFHPIFKIFTPSTLKRGEVSELCGSNGGGGDDDADGGDGKKKVGCGNKADDDGDDNNGGFADDGVIETNDGNNFIKVVMV